MCPDMPSQRLLKILDPWGHVGERRVLAQQAPTAVLWSPDASLAAWMAAELRSVGVEPLAARSFRHVEASLRANTHPRCAIAIVDLASADYQALCEVRWAGYAGPIIGVAAVVDAKVRTLLQLDAIVAPRGKLGEAVHSQLRVAGTQKLP